jgi:hypothetical protein
MTPQGAQTRADQAAGAAPTYVMNIDGLTVNMSPKGQEALKEITQELQDLSRRMTPSRR